MACSPADKTYTSCFTLIGIFTSPANQSFVITSMDVNPADSGTYSFSLGVGNNPASLDYALPFTGPGSYTEHFSYPSGYVVPPNTSLFMISLIPTRQSRL